MNKPEAGEPINLQIVFDRPFNFFRKQSDADIARVSSRNGAEPVPYWSENYNQMREDEQIQIPTQRGSRMLSTPYEHEESIHNHQQYNEQVDLSTEKPTLNIHLPSRLPFNVFDLFNPEAIRGFFRNITQNGINISSNHLFSRSGAPASSAKSEINSGPVVDNGLVVPTSQPIADEYADESKINKQVETLNEVLTDRIKNRTVGPPNGQENANAATFQIPFFPDLSSLGQLWGGQNAKSYGVCNACRVAFGLLSLKVSFSAFICEKKI